MNRRNTGDGHVFFRLETYGLIGGMRNGQACHIRSCMSESWSIAEGVKKARDGSAASTNEYFMADTCYTMAGTVLGVPFSC